MRLLLTLLHTLTFRKVLAWFRSQYAFLLARVFGMDCTASHPPYVTVEPTNRCNLNCPECITGSGQMTRKVGDMSLQQFSGLVDKIYKSTIVLNLYMQGEPYLNKDLPEMIAYAKSKGLFVSLSTNGQRLPSLSKESLPHHLIISVDGANQESYESYRVGGQLSKVQVFVASVAQWKKETRVKMPYVELQFLIHRHNETEVEATKRLFKGQFNRFVVKSMQIINAENVAEFTPQATCCNRYVNDKAVSRACYKMLSTSVFTQEGQLALCCMDKNAEFVRGNIFDSEHIEILRNDTAHSYRRMLIQKKSKMAICQNCPFA